MKQKYTWIEMEEIARQLLNEFLSDKKSDNPLFDVSHKVLRDLIIIGLRHENEISEQDVHNKLLSEMQAEFVDLTKEEFNSIIEKFVHRKIKNNQRKHIDENGRKY